MEHTFCMTQFKPAIAGLAILVIVVLGWTGWHCTQERARATHLTLAAAAGPTAPPIRVNDKMRHPYWGNCNKCHVTTNAGKPVSKVMAGAPISIKDKMPHKYWGNCLLCHKVIDGFQPKKKPAQAMAAAQTRFTSQSLGLKVKQVTKAMMQQFGLGSEDGVLVLDVTPNSIAAGAGLRKGDEIIRVGKIRVETIPALDAALNSQKPGSQVKVNIFRGKKSRNLRVMLPKQLWGDVVPAAATAPMTQNRIETLAEQLGVPKTQQDVTRALQQQKQGQAVAAVNTGQVAVGAAGPGIGYQVANQFGASPYFVVLDPQLNQYKVVANPNANDVAGRGVQTGQYVVDLGVSNVSAGGFDPYALQTLHTLRVNAYSGVTGSVRDVLNTYLRGNLVPTQTNVNLWATRPRGNTSPGGGVNVQPHAQPIF